MQRSKGFAAVNGIFGLVRLAQHPLWLNMHERIQPGILLLDALQIGLSDLDGRDLFLANHGSEIDC